MRNIVNISLPREMVVDIKRGVKAGKFASTSEFMRHLIRLNNSGEFSYYSGLGKRKKLS